MNYFGSPAYGGGQMSQYQSCNTPFFAQAAFNAQRQATIPPQYQIAPQTQELAPAVNTMQQSQPWTAVPNEEAAKNQIVMPGQTVYMMDNNDTVFYTKSADASGIVKFRKFRFAEEQAAESADTVSKEDFRKLQEELAALKKSMDKEKK